MLIIVTKEMLKNALIDLGVEKGMVLEVHSSLSSFGEIEGGAETVINTLKEIVTEEGSIFMPALRLSRELPLTEEDKKLGITVKIKVLPPYSDRTAMGLVADTFRKLPDTYTGQDVISTSGWGRHGKEAAASGLDYPIYNGGKALMLGVDIYKLTAMHYVEGITPEDINKIFEPTDEINQKYSPDKWFMEAGHPPVKAWYKIQEMAYEKGLIRETAIGDCKVMFFDIWSVLSLLFGNRKVDGIDRRSSEIPGLGSARTRTESKTESVISKIGICGGDFIEQFFRLNRNKIKRKGNYCYNSSCFFV